MLPAEEDDGEGVLTSAVRPPGPDDFTFDTAMDLFADIEATERARSYFTGYGPSSPSIAILKDGELVYILERYQIEGRDANQIAGELTQAFDQHCAS